MMLTVVLLPSVVAAAVARGSPPPPPGVHRACTGSGAKAYKFCDASLTPAERAADIVSRLTLDEKPALMTARHSAAVPRLGIPAYDWGVNSIHGDQVGHYPNCHPCAQQ
jgi:hypothetical protein